MAIPVTVCGLYVDPEVEPNAWNNGCYWQDLAELDLGVALGFIREEVHAEALRIGKSLASFIAAAVHLGSVLRHDDLPFADMPVDGDLERGRWPEQAAYTVCGVFADTWETYSGPWTARGPVMAYFGMWEMAQRQGRSFLLAGVHDGIVEQAAPMRFADPLCKTTEEMADAMRTLLIA